MLACLLSFRFIGSIEWFGYVFTESQTDAFRDATSPTILSINLSQVRCS